ncbi:MAG: metallophosphoesterase, partial [Magnetococcales bacterium]|nr:metallophosphoesterase [Magnetococcales bacterium]
MIDPMHILHLSDLHFGPKSRFAERNPDKVAIRLGKSVQEMLPTGEKVRLVIITGDIAEAAKPREYELAEKFLRALPGSLGMESANLLLLPGNHDVSWGMCRSVAEELEAGDGFSEEAFREGIREKKLQFYAKFVSELQGESQAGMIVEKGEHGPLLWNISNLGVSVAALDSCFQESHQDHRGALDHLQINRLMALWREDDANCPLRIVALHHGPDREMERQLKRLVEECRVGLILHGHQHEHSNVTAINWQEMGMAHVLGAGSMGVERATNTCRLMTIRNRELLANALAYYPNRPMTGESELGAWSPDPNERSPFRQPLHLALRAQATPANRSEDVTVFLQEYRQRLGYLYDRWDLRHAGAAQAGGAYGKPIEVNLERMYVPLRLGKDYNPEKLDQGRVHPPEEIPHLQDRLVIRGVAGCGKTTWMRWTFRHLLQQANVFPVLLELRALARHWGNAPQEKRNLEGFFTVWCKEYGLGGWWQPFWHHLTGQAGPIPVLLVDGWDELGDLGNDFRAHLLPFLQAHPRVRVVVSSRPYGEGRPSHSDGFKVLDVQPLDDGEIRLLTDRFYREAIGEQGPEGERRIQEFMDALKRTPEALALSRTALLLTMMLLISRSSPLPVQRHKLYQLSLENLLTALPDRKEASGVRGEPHRWRPRSGKKRMRVTAALAFGVQDKGYQQSDRATLIRPWSELATLLPEKWSAIQKDGFLSWLAGPAGVLTERSDDTLSFTHLSFQEFLSAWHMNATVEGEGPRIKACQDKMEHDNWWETLRLWAALVAVPGPERLRPVLHALLKDADNGLWLAGTFLADGLLEMEDVTNWQEAATKALERQWWQLTDEGLAAWRASRQAERRSQLEKAWQQMAKETHNWLAVYRFSMALKQAGLKVTQFPLAFPLVGSMFHFLEGSEPQEEKTLVAGRVLVGGPPHWPDWPESLLLSVWPGQRRQTGLRAQNLLLTMGEKALSVKLSERLFLYQDDQATSNLACNLGAVKKLHGLLPFVLINL